MPELLLRLLDEPRELRPGVLTSHPGGYDLGLLRCGSQRQQVLPVHRLRALIQRGEEFEGDETLPSYQPDPPRI